MKTKFSVFVLIILLGSCQENFNSSNELSKNQVTGANGKTVKGLSCAQYGPIQSVRLADATGQVISYGCYTLQPNTNYYLIVDGFSPSFGITLTSGAVFTSTGGLTLALDSGPASSCELNIAPTMREARFQITTNSSVSSVTGSAYSFDSCGNPYGSVPFSFGQSCSTSATITIDYQSGYWIVTATNAGPVTLHGNVSGFPDMTTCSRNQIVDDDDFTLTLCGGGTDNYSFKDPNDPEGGMGCSVKYYKIVSHITINGVLVNNGGAVTIGGITYHVTINNTSCTAYPC